MIQRLFLAVGVLAVIATGAVAQTVRFETNAGNFDLVLNPTNNPELQGNVDNLLQYVTSGRYDNTVINRAAKDFVVQMGIFKSPGLQPPATIASYLPIEKFAPVVGVPAAELPPLSNSIGTVAFGLSADGMGGANQDSATSSFYVNMSDNAYLDTDFTVFGVIPDMTAINAINALSRLDYTADPSSGTGGVNLWFTDVPLLPNGNLVIISRAFVVAVPEPSAVALMGSMLVCAAAAGVRRR